MFALTMAAEAAHESAPGFFLDHAWVIPALPAASFLIILLFGKRLPRGGSEVGIPAVALWWVFAVGVLAQWINRVDTAGGHSGLSSPPRASP